MKANDLIAGFSAMRDTRGDWLCKLVGNSTKFGISSDLPEPDQPALESCLAAVMDGFIKYPASPFYIERGLHLKEKIEAIESGFTDLDVNRQAIYWTVGGNSDLLLDNLSVDLHEEFMRGSKSWWWVTCGLWYMANLERVSLFPLIIAFDYVDHFMMACPIDADYPQDKVKDDAECFARSVMRSLIWINTDRVRRRFVDAPVRLNKARARKGKPPISEYWTLSIDPSVVQAARKHQGGTHASPRLHIRRGHQRRLHGGERVTWVRPCLVGAADQGTITKDYEVTVKP